MPKRDNNNLLWIPAFVLLALIPLLIGCNPSFPGTSTPKLDSSPKGPGPTNLTATARATPISTRCPAISATPASTVGWNIYKDIRFSFHVSVPPGWRAGSFTDDSGSDYIVQFFPPDSTTPFGQRGFGDREHFEIVIPLSGPANNYANNPDWRPEATKITINGTKTTLYDRTTPDCGQINRGATANFGEHDFTFFMVSTPEKAKNDIALFLGMLQSFVYSG